jgi:hypothetical protein
MANLLVVKMIQTQIDKPLLSCHLLAFLPLATSCLYGYLDGDFNYNYDLAGYTGPGQVIHRQWEFPWSTPICLAAGIVALRIGIKRRNIVALIEGGWCCLAAVFDLWTYPLYVHFE